MVTFGIDGYQYTPVEGFFNSTWANRPLNHSECPL